MSFSDTLKAHHEKLSNEAARQAVNAAAVGSSQAIKLQTVIALADPIVTPVFQLFVEDVVSKGYQADWHFEKQEPRCWWSLRFIQGGKDQSAFDFTKRHNEFSASVRGYADGELHLEMSFSEIYLKHLTEGQRRTKVSLAELSHSRLESWLDDFAMTALKVWKR